ncbi:MAG: helix-turn-helix domain-containing protein [Oscillospiraceae bacterium]|nr:helix-turn-helix domain-containing protein [Oscillospiraceae bacterium]
MKVKDIFRDLRKQHNLSQDEMAAKLFVTRQAVSRWETGETVPAIETLALISKTFGVSINTLLGQPSELYCQACGMPLKDGDIVRQPDGSFDEDYCKYCVVDGKYVGPDTVEGMIEVCVPHMGMPEEAARAFLREQLPKLKHWRKAEE